MACNNCNKKWLTSHGSKPDTHKTKGFFGDDGELPQTETAELEQKTLEEEYFMGDPHIPKKSRGLGDTVAKITKATGIKATVDKVFDSIDKDCGCKERQSKLNKLFPYGKRKKTKGFFE